MRPAPSLIVFSTLSGAGFGALAWSGMEMLSGAPAQPLPLLVSTVLAIAGLLSSVTHLGQPLRAWRAFSQWRSSWLSREAWLASLTLITAAALILAPHFQPRVLGAVLLLGSLGTVACTAMIYHSLPPVPAWRIASVPAIFVVLAAFSGAYLLLLTDPRRGYDWAVLCALLAIIPATQKLRYWRELDTLKLPSGNAALGMSESATVRAFEAPHTETNYLLHEMVFKLARRHSQRLRRISVLLSFVLAPACAAAILIWPPAQTLWAMLSISLLLPGLLVERWLFFAEARHVVERYYAP